MRSDLTWWCYDNDLKKTSHNRDKNEALGKLEQRRNVSKKLSSS